MDHSDPDPITVDVVGDATHELAPGDLPDDPTCGDLLRAVGISRHEATALVDGRPVPEDTPVSPGDRVEVLRLIQGG